MLTTHLKDFVFCSIYLSKLTYDDSMFLNFYEKGVYQNNSCAVGNAELPARSMRPLRLLLHMTHPAELLLPLQC